MSNTLKPVPATESFAIIPQAEETAIIEFDSRLTMFRERLADPKLSDIMRATIQAKAILDIEARITESMMSDFKALMNSPLGFKTDRPPGAKDRDHKPLQPYSDTTIKRCAIVALMSGARMTGDEWNIIAGQCYLTKKFLRPAILNFPGLSDLETQMGTPSKHGERTAVLEAIAKWKVNGRPFEIKCTKGDATKGEIDSRIVVNCFSTSSPDELLGKAERKLFARIFARLTGLNVEPEDENTGVRGPVIIDSVAVETEIEPTTGEQGNLGDRQTANHIYLTYIADIERMDNATDIGNAMKARRKLIQTSEWSDELKAETIDKMAKANKERIEAIRATRGERSNAPETDQPFIPLDEAQADTPDSLVDKYADVLRELTTEARVRLAFQKATEAVEQSDWPQDVRDRVMDRITNVTDSKYETLKPKRSQKELPSE